MLGAFLLLAAGLSLADWTPARWPSADPKTLDLVAETPINCLLLEQPFWTPEFVSAAAGKNVVTLGILHPGTGVAEAVRLAAKAGLAGVVLEGDFETAAARQAREVAPAGFTVLELRPRATLDYAAQLVGTHQGLWPGIRVQAKAAASGGPWVDTNTGFLRFVRAMTGAPVWMGNVPPAKTVIPVRQYLQAIADAELAQARWVIALDDDFSRRLMAREPAALADWRGMSALLRFYEGHKDWRALAPYGQLVVVEDIDSGALYSGGVLDMVGAKQVPVRVAPRTRLAPDVLRDATMAANVDPRSLSGPETEILRAFARGGGTVLNAPPGVEFPAPRPDRVTLDEKQQERIGDIWRDINGMIGRSNPGVRLFNVAGMLSSLRAGPKAHPAVLDLVNYTGYPVEAITILLPRKIQTARLYSPEAPPRDLKVYTTEDGGTGVDVPQVSVVASIVLD
jgi:hypothetical protein